MAEQLNIESALKRGSLEIKPEEHDDERKARLIREERESKSDNFIKLSIFLVSLVVLLTLGGMCSYFGLFDANASVETKRWAQNGLSALFGACVGYFLGGGRSPQRGK